MTTNPRPSESRMLELVRRWRREVYQAEQGLPEAERHRRSRELARRFGLTVGTRPAGT